jgi:hypothetical protein
MAKTLWLIQLHGAPAGRFWAPVVASEYDVKQELISQGYDPEITVSLGDVPITPEVVPLGASDAMEGL